MKKGLFLSLSMVWCFCLSAQQTITVQVNTINDDLEEYLPGPTQTKTVGGIDAGSSDLELGNETAGNVDPQLVGLRFTGVNIPKNAWIASAYLQFEVDNTNKNTDPCNLWIKAQDSDNPVTFDPTPFNLSQRPKLQDSVYWAIPAGSWTTVGAHDADQRSTDISKLVQSLVTRDGWVSGNAMAFFLYGSGLREAESFDGSATGACKLIINFEPASSSVTAQVSAAEDDLEEYLPGANQTKTVGDLDAGSSDLELGCETANNVDPQLVGVRFANLAIPKGAKISNARLQFQVDNTNKNTDPCAVWIKAQNSVTPLSFTTTPFDISSRPTLTDSVYWSIPAASWTVVGQNGADQRSSNIARLVQKLVDRADWASGNAMVFTLAGKGLREAESYDGLPAGACKLLIDYALPSVAVNDPAVLGQHIQVVPNPFDKQTNISFELKEQAQVRIEVYDQLGRLVQVLAQARMDAGIHTFRFETNQAGVYYSRIIVNGAAAVVKMVKQ
ncbi:MAG: T9SS type A sorting domain-containing protein [Bacteroidetes bacterium]|nr:T9SS type A sorting domain-containing protein [Bacteroidota bacterium]